MAVKPWLGALKDPTGYKNPKDQNKPPDVTIQLNYVFGYRAKYFLFFLTKLPNSPPEIVETTSDISNRGP